jgi:hypothetical protein
MNSSSNYKSIKEILNSLNQSIGALEGGELNVDQLEEVLQDARELHERIAILQYMSILPKEEDSKTPVEVVVEKVPSPAKKPMNFQFAFDDSEPITPTNQINLLDAIQEEEVPMQATERTIKSESIPSPIEKADPVEKTEVKEQQVVKETLNEKLEDHQTESLNDKFSEQKEKVSLADRLGKKPIPDLVKAIGLNQKFLFMNDLFEGENNHYKEAINNLNNFASFIEADEYINTLRTRHNWESSSHTVKEFVELVERRYS